MSCNGCRVLRKGCSEDCSLRPCLQWIKSPKSQANATFFLAKFYGRTGLMNLINAGPVHDRPAIFKSLLYEACGRITDPINGSVGLISSGNWPQCLEAVEAVLNGSSLMMSSSADELVSPLQQCNIRHVSNNSATSQHQVKKRRATKRSKSREDSFANEFMNEEEAKFTITGWECDNDENGFSDQWNRATSHNSSEAFEQEIGTRENSPVWHVQPEFNECELDLTL